MLHSSLSFYMLIDTFDTFNVSFLRPSCVYTYVRTRKMQIEPGPCLVTWWSGNKLGAQLST